MPEVIRWSVGTVLTSTRRRHHAQREAEWHSQPHREHGLAKHHADDVSVCCANRHADPDLPRSAAHGVRHQPVQADHRQRHSHQADSADHSHHGPELRRRPARNRTVRSSAHRRRAPPGRDGARQRAVRPSTDADGPSVCARSTICPRGCCSYGKKIAGCGRSPGNCCVVRCAIPTTVTSAAALVKHLEPPLDRVAIGPQLTCHHRVEDRHARSVRPIWPRVNARPATNGMFIVVKYLIVDAGGPREPAGLAVGQLLTFPDDRGKPIGEERHARRQRGRADAGQRPRLLQNAREEARGLRVPVVSLAGIDRDLGDLRRPEPWVPSLARW